MLNNTFALKGTFCYSKDSQNLIIRENAYLICNNGISEGIYEELPACFQGIQVIDHTNRLIIPGLIDLHLHAPQYTFRGTGMDLEPFQRRPDMQNLIMPKKHIRFLPKI